MTSGPGPSGEPGWPGEPGSPGWTVPDFPHEPQDEPELLTVPDAYLTRVTQGPLRTVQAPLRWLRGAVHDADGRLVMASQKIGGLGGNEGAQADPRRTRPRPGARRLSGTWLYGGHWINHFGHFFTETVTTLWPEDLEVDGLVFHAYFGGHAGEQPWQTELIGMTGYGGLPVEVVADEPLRVERLLVPSRSVVVNGWAHSGALDVWRRMAASVGPAPDGPGGPGGPDKVFFSRRAFNATRRDDGRDVRTDTARDEALDRVFAAAGFAVIAPETLPVPEQIRLAAGADVLAGSAGTALHLSAFAPAGTRVLELGDSRSPDVQVPQQKVVDHLCGHPSAFVPYAAAPDEVATRLRALGLDQS